jgi:hypothetical protein
LNYKKNVTFITADRDFLAIVLVFVESLSQGIAFNSLILQEMTDIDKKKILRGKKKTLFIDYNKFKTEYNGVMFDILNRFWQKDFLTFKIRFWDRDEQIFIKDLILKFDKNLRILTLNMHGPLNCSCAKNDDFGKWMHYYYWPPPLKSPDVVRVRIEKKPIVRKNIFISEDEHNNSCKYANDDKNNRLNEYFGFWL